MAELSFGKLPSDEYHWALFMNLTLVQVMAWCRQATSHYLSQCWSRYLSPHGFTRPQWFIEVQRNYRISRDLIVRFENFQLKFENVVISLTWWRHQMKNLFRVTGPLCEEVTGHRWIHLTKTNNAELWCFLRSVPEQTAEQTIETPVIWGAITVIITSL